MLNRVISNSAFLLRACSLFCYYMFSSLRCVLVALDEMKDEAFVLFSLLLFSPFIIGNW